jgi:hypothetical protein
MTFWVSWVTQIWSKRDSNIGSYIFMLVTITDEHRERTVSGSCYTRGKQSTGGRPLKRANTLSWWYIANIEIAVLNGMKL